MIKYEDAELISVLPSVLSSEPSNVAISYAYKMAMEKIIRFSIQTCVPRVCGGDPNFCQVI